MKSQMDDLREKGLLGSPEDPFWDPVKKIHACCGSPRSYYHRAGCPACREIGDDEPVAGYSVPKLNAGAWRKDPGTAKTMYFLYIGSTTRKPMSLQQIATAYGISRQAVYDTFHSRKWPLRSKRLAGSRIVDGVRYTFDGAGYLRGTRDGKRVYLHRLVWRTANGPVPPRFQLHFKDDNKENCTIENLELIPFERLSRTFNPTGRNQFSTK